MDKEIEKDCWNCEYTRVEDGDEPCASCEDYNKWEDDSWMNEDGCRGCGCKDGNHAQECPFYYNAGYGKRKVD